MILGAINDSSTNYSYYRLLMLLRRSTKAKTSARHEDYNNLHELSKAMGTTIDVFNRIVISIDDALNYFYAYDDTSNTTLVDGVRILDGLAFLQDYNFFRERLTKSAFLVCYYALRHHFRENPDVYFGCSNEQLEAFYEDMPHVTPKKAAVEAPEELPF